MEEGNLNLTDVNESQRRSETNVFDEALNDDQLRDMIRERGVKSLSIEELVTASEMFFDFHLQMGSAELGTKLAVRAQYLLALAEFKAKKREIEEK